jgi:hypothetical protein
MGTSAILEKQPARLRRIERSTRLAEYARISRPTRGGDSSGGCSVKLSWAIRIVPRWRNRQTR